MLFNPLWEYRRKPETVTITVNGREFVLPKWETESLNIGDKYFTVNWICCENGIAELEWCDDDQDEQLFKSNSIHLSRENALEWVKLWKFMTGGGK
jgi:hypothetical protein